MIEIFIQTNASVHILSNGMKISKQKVLSIATRNGISFTGDRVFCCSWHCFSVLPDHMILIVVVILCVIDGCVIVHRLHIQLIWLLITRIRILVVIPVGRLVSMTASVVVDHRFVAQYWRANALTRASVGHVRR